MKLMIISSDLNIVIKELSDMIRDYKELFNMMKTCKELKLNYKSLM